MSKEIVCSSYVIENRDYSKVRAESFANKDGASLDTSEVLEIAVFNANPNMEILTDEQAKQMEENLNKRVTARALQIKRVRNAGIDRN